MQQVNDREHINRNTTAFLCLLYIWPLVFALLNYYFVRAISGTVLCVVYYACLFMTYYCYGDFRIVASHDMAFLMIFLFIYGVISLASGEYVLIYNYVFLLPIVLLSRKSIDIDEKHFRHFFIAITLFSFFITMVLTLKTLVQYPGASRVLASNSFAQYGLEKYRRMGTGGFDFIYSTVIILPVNFVAILKLQKGFRMMAVIFFAVAVMAILFSGYTTAILLLVLIPILFLCTANKRNIFIVVVMIPLAIWAFREYRVDIADQTYELAGKFGSKAVEGHLIELADILAQKSSVDDLERVNIYYKSVTAFFTSPLFGTYAIAGTSLVSGHSTLLDILGGGGLLCFVPYIAFLSAFYLHVKKMLHDRWTIAGWNITTVLYVLLQCVNPIFANYLIMFTYMAIAVVILKSLDKVGGVSNKPSA